MMQSASKRPAVFVDRDGTLVEEVNFLHRVEELRIFPFAEEALRTFRSHGFSIVVVTNQSGIGRGIYSESDMHDVHREISTQLPGLIDGFYFCPHLPDEGCRCRKPNLGMIEDAVKERNIDLNNSWMIGDKELDVRTGINAGIRTAMVGTGYGMAHRVSMTCRPDILGDDLGDAARQINVILEAEKAQLVTPLEALR